MRDCGHCAAECLGALAPALPHQQLQHAQAPRAAPRSAPACQRCSLSATGGRRAPRQAAHSQPPTLWRARPPSAALQAREVCTQQILSVWSLPWLPIADHRTKGQAAEEGTPLQEHQPLFGKPLRAQGSARGSTAHAMMCLMQALQASARLLLASWLDVLGSFML